ncbi:WXG100 family type VII secretion target [Actinoplanes sp. CA-131856]
MSDFQFSFNEADLTMEKMQSINQGMDTALAELEASVQTNLNGQWVGAAAQQYTHFKAVWAQSATEMNNHLQEARLAFAQISQTYGMTESQIAALWQR